MENNKSRVLFFLFGGVGGAERMTVNIGKMLPKEKYEVKFVVCWRKNDICQFIPKDYEIIRIPWHNIYCFPRLRMSRVILREKPDYVFSSTMVLNILLLQVSSWFKLKCIVRNNNMLSLAKTSLFNKMKRWYPKAYRIVAQQEEMHDELVDMLSLPPEKVVTLHNVIDIDNIDKKLIGADSPFPKDDSINYVWVGRVSEQKGHDVLIKALHELRKAEPRAHVYFVGGYDEGGAFYKKLQSLIQEYSLTDYVHFVGYDNNPYRWVKFSDCFVLPSRLEGLPNALIEAQYIGRPCVATECIPMISRIISDGVNGFVVESENVHAMAVAMEKAIQWKKVSMTYKSSTREEYIKLFEI